MLSRSQFRFPLFSAALLGSLFCTASVLDPALAADTQAAQGSSTKEATTEVAATEVAANALLAADVPRLVGIVRRDRESRSPGEPPSPEAQAAMTQLSQTIRAEAVSPTFRAMALMALGEFDKACELLFDSGAELDDLEPEGLLLIARCRDAAGDFDGAIQAYERLEKDAPGEYIIPLELGSVYQRAGRTGDARRAYQRALTNNPPPIIGDNLAAVVSQLKAAKNWRIDVEVGAVSSTNINNGIGAGTVRVGGLEFDVAGANSEKGTGAYLEATGSALIPQDDVTSLLIQGLVNTDRYFTDDDNDFDTVNAALGFGPIFQFGATTWTIGPIGSISLIDDEKELIQGGVQTRLSRPIFEVINLFAQSSYLGREVDESDAQDSGRFAAAIGFDYQLFSFLSVGAGYEFVYEDASEGFFTHRDHSPLVSFNSQITDELNFNGSFRFTDADYEENDPTFDIERDDEIYRVDVNLAYDLSRLVFEGLEARAEYNYIERDSNNPLFDFERHTFRLGMGITF